MQNKYLLKTIVFSFKSLTDSHYVFASTTGGGLLCNSMNQPLNGVADVCMYMYVLTSADTPLT